MSKRPRISASSNPSGGIYVGGPFRPQRPYPPSCEWCDRPAEWKFHRRQPRIAATVDGADHNYGCGIHWLFARTRASE